MRQRYIGNRATDAVGIIVMLVLFAVTFLPIGYIGANRNKKADEAACLNNMKQLGLGFLQYAQDYDGRWPGGSDHWAGALYGYEKSPNVYKCREDRKVAHPPLYPISYGMNGNLPGGLQAQLSMPQSTVLAVEVDGTALCDIAKPELASQYTDGREANRAWGGIRLGTTEAVANPTRHDPSVAFVAADGHVKVLRPEKVSSGIDNTGVNGMQDAVHAAGTKAVNGVASPYTLTFSER